MKRYRSLARHARRIKSAAELALVIAAAIPLTVFVLVAMAVEFKWRALRAPAVERANVRRWQEAPGLRDVFPGTPGWASREDRVNALVTAIDSAPLERFDALDPSGIVGWAPLYGAPDTAPRAVREAVDRARSRTGYTVVTRARRQRPDAGGEDYSLHDAWLLWESHWQAAERAAAAGAVAILLEGFLPDETRSAWAAMAGGLVGGRSRAEQA